MKRTEPTTFVVGVVPFFCSSLKTDSASPPEVAAGAQPLVQHTEAPSPPPEALKALVRLLARQAARQDLEELRNPSFNSGD